MVKLYKFISHSSKYWKRACNFIFGDACLPACMWPASHCALVSLYLSLVILKEDRM